jgi:hypothetical protein
MTTVFIAAMMALAGEPEATELKGFHIYQEQVRDTLRREATAESPGRRAAAIHDLAALYEEVASDQRLETSDTLSQLRIKLWSRLTAIKRDLERQIARDAKVANKPNRSAEFTSPGEEDDAAEALAARLARMGYSFGGPGGLAAGNEAAFGGGAIGGDWGPALVNLIERTIAPEKWDTAGGPFSIVYYAPLRVLVVRATGEVHGNVRGALGGLRGAGP